MNEPILAEEDWQRLSGEESSPPPNPRQVALVTARNRRWSVVIATVSLGLFLSALTFASVDLHVGADACGTAMSSTNITQACEDEAEIFRVWAIVLVVLSIGAAGFSFRLRWGRGWQESRLSDL